MMTRLMILLLPVTLLSGCLSLNGLTSTAGATAGATLGSLVSPTTGIVAGVAGGLAADAVTPSVPVAAQDFAGADGNLSFTELLAFMWVNFTSNIIVIGIAITLIWFLTGYLGLRSRRPEEKQLEQLLINKIKE